MFHYIWANFLFNPIYNTLVFLIGVVPYHDLGIAIIILTIIIKTIILPFSQKILKDQAISKAIEPKIREIKEKHKEDKDAQTRKLLEIYKEHKINPLSSLFLVIIQIFILLALYFVIIHVSKKETEFLYSFVQFPETVKFTFLGLIDLSKGSIIIAFLASITQYIQVVLMSNKNKKEKGEEKPTIKSDKPDLKADLAKSMEWQMKYFLPALIFFISFKLSAAIPLYWVASNVYMIFQTMLLKSPKIDVK